MRRSANIVKRVVASGLATVMVITLTAASQTAAHATDSDWFTGPREDLRTDEPVAVHPVEADGIAVMPQQPADQLWQPDGAAAVLPAAGTTVFDLDTGERSSTGEGGDRLPVAVSVPSQNRLLMPEGAISGRASVQVFDQQTARAAGVDGLLVAVSGAGVGPVDLVVDYSSFARLYGGGWALRLSWKQLPACAATTPQVAGCVAATPVDSVNRAGQQTVSTRLWLDEFATQHESVTRPVPSGMQVFALTADESGDGAGDYSATDLSPAGSWNAGGNDGSFTYSYPLRLPPAAGPMPSVSLGYSSASHDGRNSGSNNQASWVGDGWGYQPGFVERSYKPCATDDEGGNNDGTPTGDLCWDGDGVNVTMSLNGTNTSLVLDDATGDWRAAADANWRIERLGSAASPGSSTSERWKVTVTDGTQFFFASEAAESASRLTVPVFGNHSGEPCHASQFDNSSCDQAYRWMLDKVIDVHGNMSRYFYQVEQGHYGAGGDADNRVAYDRAVMLERIDYGLRDGDVGIRATGRVVFTTDDRCLDACWDGSKPKAENWPDTPWDLDCDSAPCTSQMSPTFFSSTRLAEVTTQVREELSFQDVDSWTLQHEFADYGDDEQVVMWLSSIQHTGHAGDTDITLPAVEFVGEALPNRVDAAPGVPVMWRWRMFAIKTETGAVITVGYDDVDCTPSSLPTNAHNNAKRCYPVRWTPAFHTEPIEDWFHKHVVDTVTQTDTTGGQVAVTTSYEYSTAGGGTSVLWAFDDSEFTDDEHRTYGQWRGYPQVTTRTGDPAAGVQQRTRTRFHRGMNNQPQPSGTRSVELTDAEGNKVVDHEALVGRVFESLTYNGSTIISGHTTEYRAVKTATRTRDHDGGDLHAWMTGVETQQARTRLTGSTWQRTETRTSYDHHGRPTEVNSLGDLDKPGDEYCTRTEYADNETAWILNAVKRSEVVSIDCDTTPSRPHDVVSDRLTFFDGSTTHGTPPTRGLATRIDVLDDWDSGPIYGTTRQTSHDDLGRAVETTDALGRTSTTSYTPTGAGPVTKTTTTNPLGHQNVTKYDPAWGSPTAVTEPNGRNVEIRYDALGRTAAVWRQGLIPGVHPASAQFEYLVRDDKPSAVTTKTLNQVQQYVTTTELYDSLLRPRQTQTDTADGGRLLTETIYDTHGRVEEQRGPHYNTQPPQTELVTVEVGESARRVEYIYDGAGRVTDEIIFNRQVERWRTITAYGGSSDGFMTAMQPPEGAPATAVVTNARGQTIEKRTYRSNQPSGPFDALTYGYTATGQLESLSDQAGNTWSWDYDLRGREIASHDPDAGTTTMTYDAAGQLAAVTDARGETLQYEYDQLGRTTARLDGDHSLLAEWEYDTAIGGIGMLGKATRWHDGEAYINQIHAVNPLGLISQESITLPASLGKLAGQHWFTQSHTINGLVAGKGVSAIGDLPQGGISFTYDHLGNMNTTAFHGGSDGVKVIVDQATYTPFGELQTRTLGAPWERQAWHGFVYEEDTRRLERSTFDRQASIHSVADVNYTYDPAGNITSIADLPDGLPANHELQCFTYDAQQRLVEAWAQGDTTACATNPGMNDLGGPAPYWNSYQHDVTGNRTAETLRLPGQTPIERDYTYPGHGQPQPHTLQQVDTLAGGSGQMQFDYDPAGNTTMRDIDGQIHTLTWDAEGRLATVDDGGDTTEMIYTADGQRLIRDDGDTVSVFLPNTEAVWHRGTDQVDATRYYTHAGHVVAVQTGTDVADWTWMGVDHHGTTATHSVNAFTAVEHIRRLDPYGNPRGHDPHTWPGQQHFVGGIKDPTSLIHIGARSYDPQTGRFITVDPILDVADDQQINGYTYANANPITYTDPTGLLVCAPDGHNFCPEYEISKQPTAPPDRRCLTVLVCALGGGPKTQDFTSDLESFDLLAGLEPVGAGHQVEEFDPGEHCESAEHWSSWAACTQAWTEWQQELEWREARFEECLEDQPRECGRRIAECSKSGLFGQYSKCQQWKLRLPSEPKPDAIPAEVHPTLYFDQMYCLVGCIGLVVDSSGVYLVVGGVGLGGWGAAVGVDSVPQSHQRFALQACGSAPVGGCIRGGPTTGDVDTAAWAGGGPVAGTGVFLGGTYSIPLAQW